MKKIILVGALALLAACGSSSSVSVSTAGGKTSTTTAAAAGSGSTAASGDTIAVKNLGEMPPQCIKLLSTFLKQIEPIVSKVDWSKATTADLEALGTQFKTESDALDSQSTAAGCDKYSITGSDAEPIKQVLALAAKEAPGTVKFLTFMSSIASSTTDASASLPTDCPGTIAAIEPYLAKGKTMKDLPITDLAKLGALTAAVSKNCTSAETTAFFGRADVKAFVAG